MTDHTEEPSKASKRFGYKKGWRLVAKNSWAMNIPLRLHQLTESHLASDEVKSEAKKLLSEITDGRLPNERYDEARRIINQNKLFSKNSIRKVEATDKVAGHAVFMACQACENLRDKPIYIASKKERQSALLQIAAAINVLSDVQFRLMGGTDDDQR